MRPRTRTRRRASWWPAWKVRLCQSSYKLNFDLHRAGGLWMWPLLFVFAWTSVALKWPEAHEAVMRGVLSHQTPAPATPGDAARGPALDWASARAKARAHAAQQALTHGFTVLAEHSLAHDAGRGVFVYDVRTSLDVQDERGNTRLLIDARDGSLRHLWRPSRAVAGDTVREWLVAMHTGALFGLPYRIAVSALGLGTTALCATGVYVWWPKRRARRFQRDTSSRT